MVTLCCLGLSFVGEFVLGVIDFCCGMFASLVVGVSLVMVSCADWCVVWVLY